MCVLQVITFVVYLYSLPCFISLLFLVDVHIISFLPSFCPCRVTSAFLRHVISSDVAIATLLSPEQSQAGVCSAWLRCVVCTASPLSKDPELQQLTRCNPTSNTTLVIMYINKASWAVTLLCTCLYWSINKS